MCSTPVMRNSSKRRCKSLRDYTLVLICIFLFIFPDVVGRVSIVNPYYPLYVLSGTPLSIICESEELTTISWSQQTPQSSWSDSTLNPTSSNGVIIETCNSQPSGFTHSTLTRLNVSLNARGTYTCKDLQSNSYTVWVTVLYIESTLVTLSANEIVLQCRISGFDTNPPAIDYDWTVNDSLIPHSHDQLSALAQSLHSTAALTPNPKYNVSMIGQTSFLTILNPAKSDSGTYNCSFTLGTNLGAVTFSQSIHVNASSIVPTISSDAIDKQCSLNLVLFSYLLLMCAVKIYT